MLGAERTRDVSPHLRVCSFDPNIATAVRQTRFHNDQLKPELLDKSPRDLFLFKSIRLLCASGSKALCGTSRTKCMLLVKWHEHGP